VTEAEIAARLRRAGLKATPQRLAIVRELVRDPTHPTAQELFERLRRELPSMSFATVYNTLDALASAGLCSALALAPGAARFDGNMGPHDHFVCDRCGLVRDLPRPARRAGASPAPSEPGFVVRSVEQIVRGFCPSCAGLEPATPRLAASLAASDKGR
jgi:Fur family peroxide stress response transcriptional regulator